MCVAKLRRNGKAGGENGHEMNFLALDGQIALCSWLCVLVCSITLDAAWAFTYVIILYSTFTMLFGVKVQNGQM